MKRKIGELHNKPIVSGDVNLVTKNEIHEDKLKSNNEDVVYVYLDSSYDVLLRSGIPLMLVRYHRSGGIQIVSPDKAVEDYYYEIIGSIEGYALSTKPLMKDGIIETKSAKELFEEYCASKDLEVKYITEEEFYSSNTINY